MKATRKKNGIQRIRQLFQFTGIACLLGFSPVTAGAQPVRHLSLAEAVRMGLDNSKQLKISMAKVGEAEAKYEQALDARLPSAKLTAMASEAFIPTRKFQFPGAQKPLELPGHSTVYLSTFGVNEAIFAGNKLKYAKESADLVKKVASLNAAKDQQDVIFAIINAYINLYKIDDSRKIVTQNLQDVQGRLEETEKFEQNGLATKNDVLRFELQKSNVQLTAIDLDNNRKIANYNMNILLGLPDSTAIEVDSVIHLQDNISPMEGFINLALSNRKDLVVYGYQKQLADLNIKNIRAGKLPELGAGVNAYYINPSPKLFPAANSYLVPITVGLNLSWNISTLYTSRHKINEAGIQQQEITIGQSAMQDQVKMDVNQQYTGYLQALQKINILETAVTQASENDRIMESKYQNQLATTTDRIDAQTLLYQSKINLELAKADAEIAYYNLLKSTGTIQP